MNTLAKADCDDLLAAVHVWYLCPEEQTPTLEAKCLPWLAPAERAHYERLATPALRRTYLAARALCRVTLSRYADADVDPAASAFVTAEGY